MRDSNLTHNPTMLLGGLTPAQFMRRHWQKAPLLVRQAIPDFNGVITREALLALAGRDDVESRLVVRSSRGRGRGQWSLEHGPFARSRFRALPNTGWTLLVQGVELHDDAAADLLQRFRFISYARIDDLMISYAVPGGGVGPHFDSYDVFLLQGPGERRWRTSGQRDLTLRAGLPLKILERFVPDDDQVLAPGDMLYLPPSIAHDGEAVTECMTYSIGFRAPTSRELAEGFLQFLPDTLPADEARYADPDLAATTAPARIDASMQRRLASMLAIVRWDRATLLRFIGCMLSEPKPNVFLDPPRPALSQSAFARRIAHARRGGIRLDRRSRMLYDATHVYLNGAQIAHLAEHRALAALADERRLDPGTPLSDSTVDVLHRAYLSGAVHVET